MLKFQLEWLFSGVVTHWSGCSLRYDNSSGDRHAHGFNFVSSKIPAPHDLTNNFLFTLVSKKMRGIVAISS